MFGVPLAGVTIGYWRAGTLGAAKSVPAAFVSSCVAFLGCVVSIAVAIFLHPSLGGAVRLILLLVLTLAVFVSGLLGFVASISRLFQGIDRFGVIGVLLGPVNAVLLWLSLVLHLSAEMSTWPT